MTDEEAATDGYHPYTKIEFVCQICTRKCNIRYTCLQICTRNGVFGYIRRGKRRIPNPPGRTSKRKRCGLLTLLTDCRWLIADDWLLHQKIVQKTWNICVYREIAIRIFGYSNIILYLCIVKPCKIVMYKSSSKPQQTSLFWDLETMLDSKHPPLHEGKLVIFQASIW